MPMDATVDGNILTNQPADYRITPREPIVDYAADGTPIVSKRSGDAGMVIEWIWGDVVDPATVNELISNARDYAIAHTIAFNDKNGDGHEHAVLWLANPEIQAGPGAAYRPLTVRFVVVS